MAGAVKGVHVGEVPVVRLAHEGAGPSTVVHPVGGKPTPVKFSTLVTCACMAAVSDSMKIPTVTENRIILFIKNCFIIKLKYSKIRENDMIDLKKTEKIVKIYCRCVKKQT
jgi:hypothetical protein